MKKKQTNTPHANHPGVICTLVRFVCMSPDLTLAVLGNALGLSQRHLAYYLDAARLLGFADDSSGRWTGTERGRALAVTAPGSTAGCGT